MTTVNANVDNRVATVWIDHPPVNVLTRDLIERTDELLSHLERDAAIDILVLRGSGSKAFSAGVSLHDHVAGRMEPTLEAFHRLCRRLVESRLLSVAYIDGHALGGGLELALACDFVLATERSHVGQPEIDVGCYPPVAVVLLPALVGEKRALELLLLGRRLSAIEAQQWGLINRVFPDDDGVEGLNRFVAQLCGKSSLVMRLARREIRRGCLDALAEVEKRYINDLLPTADCAEGVQAFLEKRSPAWTGQ